MEAEQQNQESRYWSAKNIAHQLQVHLTTAKRYIKEFEVGGGKVFRRGVTRVLKRSFIHWFEKN